MQDKKFDLCISMAHAWAYMAWASTVALLLVAVVEDDLIWAAFGLAMSAVAATLHIRCFMIHLHRTVRIALCERALSLDPEHAVRPIH